MDQRSTTCGWQRIAARIGVASAALLLTAAAVDLAGRPLLASRLFYRPNERYTRTHERYAYLQRFAPRSSFEGQSIGDLAAITGNRELREPRPLRFTTDRYGFQNPPGAPDGNPIDLLILGDSFGLGVGTSEEQTWPYLLREKTGLRVYNLSQVGNPYQHLLNLQAELPHLRLADRPTVLLLVFGGNDLTPPYSTADLPQTPQLSPVERTRQAIRSFVMRSPWRMLHNSRPAFLPSADKVLLRTHRGRPIAFFAPYRNWSNLATEQLRAQEAYEPYVQTLHRIHAYCAVHGMRLVVASVPAKEEVYRWVLEDASTWPDRIEPSAFTVESGRTCTAQGIPFLDLTPGLFSAARTAYAQDGSWLWWADDTHPNAKGHAVVASAVRDFLAALP